MTIIYLKLIKTFCIAADWLVSLLNYIIKELNKNESNKFQRGVISTFGIPYKLAHHLFFRIGKIEAWNPDKITIYQMPLYLIVILPPFLFYSIKWLLTCRVRTEFTLENLYNMELNYV